LYTKKKDIVDIANIGIKIFILIIFILILFLNMDKTNIIKKTKLLLAGDKGVKKFKIKAMIDINIMPKIIFCV
jgi:hypothetical protein